YGFILRYPKGKEMVTGYQYEPWHLRYVGVERAAEMAERKLTLEEYVYASTTALTENKSEQ
ncbi:M15 family metallopeptidase, partial [Paenibacillus polymyxa]